MPSLGFREPPAAQRGPIGEQGRDQASAGQPRGIPPAVFRCLQQRARGGTVGRSEVERGVQDRQAVNGVACDAEAPGHRRGGAAGVHQELGVKPVGAVHGVSRGYACFTDQMLAWANGQSLTLSVL
jgi:hypothetical protein